MSLLPDREFRPLLNEVHRGLPAQCGKDTGMKPLCAAPPKASFTLFSSEIPSSSEKDASSLAFAFLCSSLTCWGDRENGGRIVN